MRTRTHLPSGIEYDPNVSVLLEKSRYQHVSIQKASRPKCEPLQTQCEPIWTQHNSNEPNANLNVSRWNNYSLRWAHSHWVCVGHVQFTLFVLRWVANINTLSGGIQDLHCDCRYAVAVSPAV